MNTRKYFLGLYILILPVFLFLDFGNLRLISGKTILIILLSILIIFSIILILEKIYLFIFKSAINSNIFPGFCFAFYLQFYYSDIKQSNLISFTNSSFLVIIFLILLGIFMIFMWSRYFKFLNKFMIIFSTLITLLFIYNFYIFLKIDNYKPEIIQNKIDSKIYKIDKNKSFNNIYFIIFDSMMPLNLFKNDYHPTIYEDTYLKDIDVDNIVNQFNQNFEYIEDSVSNYNNSALSISSIFNNDYFIDNKSRKYKDYKDFYPHFFYNQKKSEKLGLLNILKKNGVKFIWFANSSFPCKNIINIICGLTENIETDIVNDFKAFYSKTPLFKILEKLTKNLENDIPTDKLIDYIKTNKDRNNFIFIHNMLPSGDILYDKNCNIVEDSLRSYITYGEKYHCAIKKVNELSHLISKHDKDSTVVITADHGVGTTNLSEDERLMDDMDDEVNPVYYDPRIFTLIKFPEKCSRIAPKVYDIISLVRYSLNCNYNEKLDYLSYSYYRGYSEDSKKFGNLIDNTKDVKRYLNKLDYKEN